MDKIVYFQCPEHGKIKGDRCIQCDTIQFLRNHDFVPADEVEDADDEYDNSPNPLQIAYRAMKFRLKKEAKRNKMYKSGHKRFWKRKPRIVRDIYPDPDKPKA